MKKFLFLIASACILISGCGKKTYETDLREVAVSVMEKGLSQTDLGHYMGTCLYHGMADLALATGDKADMDRVMDILGRINSGEINVHYTSFIDYTVGGQAASLLAWKGETSLVDTVKRCAARMWKEQARTADNVMTGPNPYYAANNAYWIDIAFTVSPFFLYAGLLENNQEYIDYAAYEAIKMCEDLYDPASDLYHQGYHHPNCPDGISEDCWSRGNGWMSMALGALLRDYPRDGAYWDRIVFQSKRFYEAVCRYQDENGVWHQEMTDPTSYVEISGSGQLLAGLGSAIESGVLDKETYLPYFERGLKGLLGYVDPDGSVGHTCQGNCVPGKGRKEDFLIRHYYYNENHSFGPVVLALAQAIKLGYDTVALDAPLGSSNDADRPRAYVKVAPERKNDVAWENDRIAFRIYSKMVDDKTANGVDFLCKSVDYPMIDKWFRESAEGLSYHEDRGEGCDFYTVGKNRGLGGTGFWTGDTLVCSLVYDNAKIVSDGPARIDFTLGFDPVEVGGRTLTESKRIEMVCGTSFYKVTETVTTSDGKDAVLAIGLTTFGDTEIIDAAEGKLFTVDNIEHKKPVGIGTSNKGVGLHKTCIGSAVVVNPAELAGYADCGPDKLVLVNVKSGEPVTYYVGATWSQQQNSGQKMGGAGFWKNTAATTTWEGLDGFYK